MRLEFGGFSRSGSRLGPLCPTGSSFFFRCVLVCEGHILKREVPKRKKPLFKNEWMVPVLAKKKWMVPEAHTGPTLYWAGWRDSSKFKFIALSVPFQLVFRVQSSCMRRCLQGERTQSNIQYHFRNYSSSILLIVLFFISLPNSNTRANTRKNVLVCMFFTWLNGKSSEVLQIFPHAYAPRIHLPYPLPGK